MSPVRGLRPWRARRCLTPKLPKPRISMRPPRASTLAISSNIALMIVSAWRCENSRCRASNSSMMPRLVIGLPMLPEMPAILPFASELLSFFLPHHASPAWAPHGLTIASLPARSGAAALVAIEPEFFVEYVFHRKARRLVLALEIGLHLLAFLVLLDRLDREPDPALTAVDLHHDRFELVVDLKER